MICPDCPENEKGSVIRAAPMGFARYDRPFNDAVSRMSVDELVLQLHKLLVGVVTFCSEIELDLRLRT